MGAFSGAVAAAATTPLDVIKTNMMCTAASRPTMTSAARGVWANGGATHFFRWVLSGNTCLGPWGRNPFLQVAIFWEVMPGPWGARPTCSGRDGRATSCGINLCCCW